MRPAPPRFPLVRLPSRRTVAVLVLAALVFVVVRRTTEEAGAVVDRWGSTQAVWVATGDLAPGRTIGPDDVGPVQRPTGALPASAPVDDPVGRVVTRWIGAGEAVVEARVAGAGRTGAAALVPAGWRAVAIPQLDGVLDLAPGDRVDVLATLDPEVGAAGGVVVDDGLVVAVADDGTATVAVPAPDAPRVAAALVAGVVALALRP